MPPTYLDEYRRKKADQSRSQQSTGNVPPNADETLPNDQAGAPADGVRPVRHVASRLTGLVDDGAPIGPDEPSDPYMDALLEGAQGDTQDESNGIAQPAGGASRHPDAGSSEASIPDDEFFERQANGAPQTPGTTPTALGSASIEPPERHKRNGRSRERAASEDRRADDGLQPRPKTIRRVGAAGAVAALTGLGVLLLTGAFASSPTRPDSQGAAITAWLAGPQQVFDVLASKTSASVRASSSDLAAHRVRPHKPRARHHARHHTRHDRQARSHPTAPVAVSAPTTTRSTNTSYITSPSSNTPSATSYHSAASSTGSTSDSSSRTTTANSPSPTQSGGSSSSTSSSSHSSSTKQPAFGASGALGPGSGAKGTQ